MKKRQRKKILAFLVASVVFTFSSFSTYAAAQYINGDTIQEVEIIDENGKVTTETTAEELTEEQIEIVEEFIEEIEVTDDFVVYADELNENGHIDGNIAVNELITEATPNPETDSPPVEAIKNSGNGNEEVYNENGEELTDYSIILDGNDSTYQTIENGTIVVGDNVDVENINDTAQFEEVDLSEDITINEETQEKEYDYEDIAEKVSDAIIEGYENQNKELTEEETQELKEKIAEEVKINENLNEIAEAGAEVVEELSSEPKVDSEDLAYYAKYKMLDSFTSETVVTFTVLPSDLTDQRFAKAIDELLRANKNVGATFILNISTNGEQSLTVAHPINGNDPYDISTNYLIWNFGDFNGDITYSYATEGQIIAPNAKVNLQVTDGRVVADSVYQNQGQEIHMPFTTETPAATAEPTSTPTLEPTSEPTSTPTEKPTLEPTCAPTEAPTLKPTSSPTLEPTEEPSETPKASEEPVPTSTPTKEPEIKPTPSVEPTSTPKETEKPTSTPSASEEPSSTPTLKPTPAATAEPTSTPDIKPTSTPAATEKPNTPAPTEQPKKEEPKPTPESTPVIASDVPSTPPGDNSQDVLGERRENNKVEKEVLGEKRPLPQTGDNFNLLIWILTFSVSLGLSITSGIFVYYRD